MTDFVIKPERMQGWMKSTVQDFRDKFGGDLDELLSEAQLHLVKCCQSEEYDPDRSAPSTWVRMKIWQGLYSTWRKEKRRGEVSHLENWEMIPDYHSDFSFPQFLMELSKDARTVAKLTTDPSKELMDLVCERGTITKRTFRGGLKEFLTNLGWTTQRIVESFEEIRRAL